MALRGHQFINLGRLPNHWTDRDTIWHTYTNLPGNGHMQKINPSSPKGHLKGVGGHKFKNVGKMPSSWTDWEQIWHTYADPYAREWT